MQPDSLGVILNPSDAQRLTDPNGRFVSIDEDTDGILAALHKRYLARAIDAWAGRNRNVFLMPSGYVVKLPRTFAGYGDNDWEGSVFNMPEDVGSDLHVQFPRKRLTYHQGVPIVFMEFVNPMTGADIVAHFGYEPDWTMSVDGGQVGLTRSGRLVAYDYGLN